MKLTLALFLCAITQVFASVDAQSVSLKKQNASLEEIIWELKAKTNLVFLYSDEDISSIKDINIDVRDAQVEVILMKCLEGTGMKCVKENNAIIIRSSQKIPGIPQVQERTLSGKVTDVQGNVLPGVTVVIDGTSIGIATDIEGKYVLTCPVGKDLALRFSFMGMKTQKVTVGVKNVINVQMEEEANRLEEAVAIGYGTRKAKDMTGAVSRLTSKDMKTVPMGASLQSMLQGRAPGVNVMISSASPTSPVSVVIRGASSLSGDSQPLWVIDGVPEYVESTSGNIANTLYNLNLNDVECVDILKDASATAIYGSRAANGVVLVTTKRGKEGMKPQLEFSARYGIQTLNSNDFRVLNAPEYIAFSKAAIRMGLFTIGSIDYFMKKYVDVDYYNAHMNNSQIDLETLTDDFFLKDAYYKGNTDWWKLMTQNAATQEYSLNLRGGAKQTSYSASIFYKNQDGIVKGGDSKLLGGTFNFDASIREIVRFKANLKASARTTNTKDDMVATLLNMRPDYPAYDEDGNINLIDSYVTNPLVELLNRQTGKGRDFSGTLGLEWDIIKGLTLRTMGTAKYTHTKNDIYDRKYYDTGKSSAQLKENESYTYVWDNTLNYINTWGKHNVVGLLGFSVEKYESEGMSVYASDFPNDDVLTDLGSAANKDKIASDYTANTLASFFARIDYKYKNRYLLTLNARTDGSSRFGADKRWGFFPSGAVAWILTEENFLKDYSNIVSYLKLRFSIGKTGSQNLGNYAWRTLMGGGAYNGYPSILPESLGNDILQWEAQTQKEFGLDYGLWNDRVRGSIGYYQKLVDNLLYSDPVPYSSSFTTVTKNIGSIKNKGIEFDVKVDIIQNRAKELNWDIDFNIARNKTTLEKLNSSDEYYMYNSWSPFRIEVGGETGTFYGFKSAGRLFKTNEELVALKNIDPETGKQTYYRDEYNYERQGDLYIMDLDGDGQITDADKTKLGNANPDFFGGFGTTLTWKGLMINASFSYSVGADRLWQEEMDDAGDLNSYNTSTAILNSYTMYPGSNTDFPRATYYGRGENGIVCDRYIHDASFLRMTALNLSYRLPKHLFGKSIVNSIDLTFQATNLFTWTKYPGMDPQGNFSTNYASFFSMGVDYSSYPAARTYNFGIKITLK